MNLDKSVYNITTTPLLAGQEWVGGWEFMDKGDIQINAFADKECKLYIHTKPFEDEETYTSFPPTGYTLNGVSPLYRVAQVGRRQVRVKLVNTSGENCTVTWVHTSFGFLRQPNAPLNTTMVEDADAIVTRSVLVGQSPNGNYQNIPSTQDGSLNVAITSPMTVFGELLTGNNIPVVQVSGVHGHDTNMIVERVVGTGAAIGSSYNDISATSGTSPTGTASFLTKDVIVYKPGQGSSALFTARFGTPQPNSIMFAGLVNGSDQFGFGFNGTTFGIFVRHWGSFEIQELTITSGASGATNATIVLNSVSYTVPLTIGTTVTNAREIAASLNSQTTMWICTQVDNKVLIRSSFAMTTSGTFSFTHATAVASFSEKSVGLNITEEPFIPITSFNNDDISSWINPVNGNVFKIDYRFLGYGDVDFYIAYPNTSRLTLIHTYHYLNGNTRTNANNPTFAIGYTTVNRGNTTPITIYGASMCGFNQGTLRTLRYVGSFSYSKLVSTEQVIFCIKMNSIFNNRVVGGVINLSSFSVSTDSNKGAIFRIRLNPVIGGAQNYTYYNSANSLALLDVAGTTVSNGEVLRTITIGAYQSRDLSFKDFEIKVSPLDVLVITAEVTSGAASTMTAAATWDEDK